ncbi:MAG TPA: SHOCT domain-containing protein [Xanthobacteraceae bacterium]|nr:SHOCT domain-containing protein [Xanthobacteraceae bacterium]
MVRKIRDLSLFTFIVLLEPVQALAQQTQPSPPGPGYYGPGPWHMWSGGYGWSMGWLGPLTMLLFFVLIIGAGILLMRGACGFAGHPHGPGVIDRWRDPSYSALQILNERFAKGEIQKDEYADKKAAILSQMPR